MERKVGEVFEYNGEKYVVEYKQENCKRCAFFTKYGRCNRNLDVAGYCFPHQRMDGKDVIFIKLKTKDMGERTLKISFEKAKEFYQKGGEFRNIALSIFTEEELTEVELPKTWEEFCENNPIKEKECFIDDCCSIIEVEGKNHTRSSSIDRNILPSRETAEAHLAYIQLHQLRNRYRQGWIPTRNHIHYCIERNYDEIYTTEYESISRFLSFQSLEIAKKFLNNFKDLIEKAGDLI